MNSERTTEEIFKNRLDAFSKRDIERLAADFTDHSIYISSTGAKAIGVNAIMEIYRSYFQHLEPGTTSAIKTMVIEGDIVFLEWTSDSPSSYVNDGVDTFVMRDGFIYAQTAKFTVTPKRDSEK